MKMEKDVLHHNLRRIVKTSAIVFVGLVLSKLLTYTYRIVIARSFGPEEYGLFSLAIMIIGWFVAFSSLGLSDGLTRFIPLYRGREEKAKIKHIIRFSLIISSILGIIGGLILFFSSNFIALSIFHNAGLTIYLKIFSILVPLSIYLNIFFSILRAFEHISWYSFIFNIFQNLTRVL